MDVNTEVKVTRVTLTLSEAEAVELYSELYRIAADGREPAPYTEGSQCLELLRHFSGLGLDGT